MASKSRPPALRLRPNNAPIDSWRSKDETSPKTSQRRAQDHSDGVLILAGGSLNRGFACEEYLSLVKLGVGRWSRRRG